MVENGDLSEFYLWFNTASQKGAVGVRNLLTEGTMRKNSTRKIANILKRPSLLSDMEEGFDMKII